MKLAHGTRVYYALPMAGPLDEDGYPTDDIPDTSDKSDTGTVKQEGRHHTGRPLLVVFWDKSENPENPECDEAMPDGKLLTVSGWALPLDDDPIDATH